MDQQDDIPSRLKAVVSSCLNAVNGVGMISRRLSTEQSTMERETFDCPIRITDETPSRSLTEASLVLYGGASFGRGITCSGTFLAMNEVVLRGFCVIQNTTESLSASTGALIVNGGCGMGGSLFVDKALNVGKASRFAGDITICGKTFVACNAEYGLLVAGGCSVDRGLRVKGSASIGASLLVTGETTVEGSLACKEALSVGSRLSVTGDVVTAGQMSVHSHLSALSMYVDSDAQSNSPDTGSFVSLGGVGIAKNASIGGTITTKGVSISDGGVDCLSITGCGLTFPTVTLFEKQGILTIASRTPSVRLTGQTPHSASLVSFEMFSFGKSFVDISYDCLQLASRSSDAYVIQTRCQGTPVRRKLVLQSGSNQDQLVLNTDGSLQTGPLQVSESLRVCGSVQVSGKLHVSDIEVSGCISGVSQVARCGSDLKIDALSDPQASISIEKAVSIVSDDVRQYQVRLTIKRDAERQDGLSFLLVLPGVKPFATKDDAISIVSASSGVGWLVESQPESGALIVSCDAFFPTARCVLQMHITI